MVDIASEIGMHSAKIVLEQHPHVVNLPYTACDQGVSVGGVKLKVNVDLYSASS